MTDDPDPHPSAAQLTAFDAGQLAEAERTAVERHIERCPHCCRTLDAIPEDPLAALVRAFAAGPDSDEAVGLAEVPAALRGHPRYRVLGVLGSGGMGVVYKAVHRLMDRVVALKVLRPDRTGRSSFAERFRDEVRALARLAHPNLVAAFDAEQAGDTHFLVMEFVPGASLDRELARRGPLPVPEACDLIRQAALALQHAHELGMVHRDVKPANLMRTADGQVKVLDFGLAHVVGAAGGAETADGVVVGTPDYLAPEQARDPRTADARADVYGLGCTLYHLLAGQPPFPAATALSTLLAHQESPPRPLRELRDDVPPALPSILNRMLAKEPRRRQATAAEVAHDLGPFTGRIDAAPPNASSRTGRPRMVLALAAAALLLAFGLGVALFPRPSLPPSSTSAEMDARTNPQPEEPAVPPAVPVVTIRPGPPGKPEMRALALAWLRESNRWSPDAQIVRQTEESLDTSLERSDGFLLSCGAQALKSRKATVLAAHPGGMFLIELPDDMAAELKLTQRERVFKPLLRGKEVRPERPRIVLSDLVLPDAGRQVGGHPVVGTVAYRITERTAGAYVLRLSYYFGKERRTVLFYCKDRTAADEGVIAFSFPPLADADGQPRGPTLVFVELASDQGGKVVVESNAVAALLRLTEK